MKKIKIYSSIALILGLLLALLSVVVPIIKINEFTEQDGSVGIIGGVDTPTLTALMKEELGCTAIEYLMKYRITVAEKQLEFTSVPIKDIANMTGFKTVQHFSRVFKAQTGTTPAEFRKNAVQKRKDDFK